MLIPGQLYKCSGLPYTITFCPLIKVNNLYTVISLNANVETNRDTVQLFLGTYDVFWKMNNYSRNSLIFLVFKNKLIARDIKDEKYMVLC